MPLHEERGHCEIMSQVAECVCCKENSATTAKINELAPSPLPLCTPVLLLCA